MITELSEEEVKKAIHFWLLKNFRLHITEEDIKLSVDTYTESVRCTYRMEAHEENE